MRSLLDPLMILGDRRSFAVIEPMINNVFFPNPVPPLAEVTSCFTTLADCEKLVRTSGPGMVKQRDIARKKAKLAFRKLKQHIQDVIENNPEQAEFIVASLGLSVRKPRAAGKAPVDVRLSETPGTVILDAKAVAKFAQYCWQMSTDQQNWTDLPACFKARTKVEGLSVAVVYSFRLRTATRKGVSEWSPVISITVR